MTKVVVDAAKEKVKDKLFFRVYDFLLVLFRWSFGEKLAMGQAEPGRRLLAFWFLLC